MTLSLKILWAVKILLALRKASEAGAPPMKSRELMAAGVPVLHYYTMSRTTNIQKIVKTVF